MDKGVLTSNSRVQVQHGSKVMSIEKRLIKERKEHLLALNILKENGILQDLSEAQLLDEVLKCMKKYKDER